MQIRSLRAAVDPVSLVLIAALALGGASLAGWKPFAFLKPKPPTAQLTQLQADLAASQAALAQARLAAEEAARLESARQAEQVRWAQQMGEGAALALNRQPAEHRTAQTQLAGDLLTRANVGLADAIGGLPPAKQAEILSIVDRALSASQAERDEARAALAVKDAELRTVSAQRAEIAAQIPALTAKAARLSAEVAETQAAVTVKTNEVKTWAELKQASDRAAGSLSAALQRWINGCLIVAAAYAFLAYILPGLLKHLDDSPVKRGLRNLSGYVLNPLLHHDAKKKISRAKSP